MIEFPEAKGAVVVLSGGMDSTIALRLAVEKYGNDRVQALSFYYKQKQNIELAFAQHTCMDLLVNHRLFDIGFLGNISLGFSANVDPDIPVPSIEEVLGDPSPKTYVPNRNMIMLSIAASLAEVKGYDLIVVGLQCHDMYGYWDTTEEFIRRINFLLQLNRKNKISLFAPFISLSKTDELKLLLEVDSNLDLLKNTITCYNPDKQDRSCGICPSCAERLKAFQNIGIRDPIPYQQLIEMGA